MSLRGSPLDVAIIVPAAGRGERMGADVPKQYLQLQGRPLLAHVLERLLALRPRELILVVAAGDKAYTRVAGHEQCRIVAGGQSRADSVLAGLNAMQAGDDDWVMVHDAARPCIRGEDVLRLFETVSSNDAGGILATPVVDTVKQSADGRKIERTIPRDGLWLAQTPQMFRYGLLRRALEDAAAGGIAITDEASAVERLGHWPALVEGSRDNIKVTTPEDITLAEYYLQEQAQP